MLREALTLYVEPTPRPPSPRIPSLHRRSSPLCVPAASEHRFGLHAVRETRGALACLALVFRRVEQQQHSHLRGHFVPLERMFQCGVDGAVKGVV